MHQITFAPTFAGWQRAARTALQAQWAPEQILWQEAGAGQAFLDLGGESDRTGNPSSPFRVPRSFIELATRIVCHADPLRWSLLYRVLWRMTQGEHQLMQIVVDADVHRLLQMEKTIRRDVHKMRAFVRFRVVKRENANWYVAWFEPEHHIVEYNASFFVDRFASMCWSILTPYRCVHWDEKHLTFTEGVTKSEAPSEDAAEFLWIQYYSHIFNPARVKTHAMQAEMPRKYWKNLPEAAVIPALLREASGRVNSMMDKSSARQEEPEDLSPAPVPDTDQLEQVRKAAMTCTACPLYRNATQTIFGEGSAKAKLVLLGEQPGDSEDLAGHPFIGPAGQLLDRALAEAGIDRQDAYVTNAVKHFKWEPSGKRRLHKKPSAREVAACRPWLEAEMRLISPQILVCLGSTAAQTVLGSDVRVLRDRGQFFVSEFSPRTFLTVHPSSLLRAPDAESRARDYARFVADLRLVAQQL